jgi:hypothetical protein
MEKEIKGIWTATRPNWLQRKLMYWLGGMVWRDL